MRRVASLMVVLGVLGAAAGCGQQPVNRVADSTWVAESAPASAQPSAPPATTAPPTTPAPPPRTAAATPPPKVDAVAKTLDFTAKTVTGTTFRGASLAGKPAV